MAIAYTWEVEDLVRIASKTIGGVVYEDLVQTVHWRLWGTDGVNTASVYGVTALDTDNVDSDAFVQFADLDAATTASWARVVMDAGQPGAVDALKAQIAATLARMASPPIVQGVPEGFTRTVADADVPA